MVQTTIITDSSCSDGKALPLPKACLSAHCPAVQRTDFPTKFSRVSGEELHTARRRQILEKYPEVVKLFGPDPRSAVFCSATVLLQLGMAWWVSTLDSLPLLLFLTYFVSGTLNHSLLLAMHEVTHGLFFETRALNQLFAIIANLPMGVPASSMFKVYHSEHHTGMGEDGVDVDIPTEIEAKLFNSIPGRMLWVFLQPVFYGVRPMIIRPKPTPLPVILIGLFQFAFDAMIYFVLGWKACVYLFLGTFLGAGLHPMSGHFVAEHFEFVKGQETYSYYGPLNWLTYNVGYHNEHHDFPRIPGTRLPLLKKMAPEFYEMPSYSSWTRVIVDFIIGRNIGLFGRVKRDVSH